MVSLRKAQGLQAWLRPMFTRRWMLGGAAAASAGVALYAHLNADDAREDNIVFLTSDDGPGAGTATIIDIAERHQIPVALFMVGMHVAADTEHRHLLQRAHESKWITVGNHSYSHCLSHYAHSYHDAKSIVADFERASRELGLLSRPVPARAPGRNVWRLPGLRIDDPSISHAEMRIEDTADDALFANGFYLYGWDVEWLHDARAVPVQASSTMVDHLIAPTSRRRRAGKVMMLMHDVMMRTASAVNELTRIIEGVRERGARFGQLSEY
jgi:peptidoglycan/xylan/chitin deacetylase (PgdA/CDA1 family)